MTESNFLIYRVSGKMFENQMSQKLQNMDMN